MLCIYHLAILIILYIEFDHLPFIFPITFAFPAIMSRQAPLGAAFDEDGKTGQPQHNEGADERHKDAALTQFILFHRIRTSIRVSAVGPAVLKINVLHWKSAGNGHRRCIGKL